VAGKGHRAFSFKWSNSWLKTDHNYFEEGDFITLSGIFILKCSASRAISSGRSVAIAKECIFSSDELKDEFGVDEVVFHGLAIGALKTPSASLQSDSTT
jgi:hypothetical protein